MSESLCRRAFEQILVAISGEKEGIVGLGSGSTVAPLAPLLKELPEGFKVVPTSKQAFDLIVKHCPERLIPLEALSKSVAITVDGADAIDLRRKIIIKGGGACQVQEKIVAEASLKYCVVINDSAKLYPELSKVSIPIEVLPSASSIILNHFRAAFPDSASFSVRQSGKGKAGPVITDNGNLIIDAVLPDELFDEPRILEQKLRRFAGVVGTGLFLMNEAIILEGSEQSYLLKNE